MISDSKTTSVIQNTKLQKGSTLQTDIEQTSSYFVKHDSNQDSLGNVKPSVQQEKPLKVKPNSTRKTKHHTVNVRLSGLRSLLVLFLNYNAM